MINRTLFITKDNWSGESAQILVDEFAGGFSWDHEGTTIQLANRRRFDDFVMYDVLIDGQDLGHQVGKNDDSDMWEARDEGDNISRQCSDLAASGWGQVGAAAKLLFNTLGG